MSDLEYIKQQGLMVILRGIELSLIPDVIRAVYDGGVRVAEVTFDPSDRDTAEKTAMAIRTIYETMGDKRKKKLSLCATMYRKSNANRFTKVWRSN